MHTTYDKGADAVYIDFGTDRSAVKDVITDGAWPFNIDLDESGNVLGIEVMDAHTIFSQEFLNNAESIGKD